MYGECLNLQHHFLHSVFVNSVCQLLYKNDSNVGVKILFGYEGYFEQICQKVASVVHFTIILVTQFCENWVLITLSPCLFWALVKYTNEILLNLCVSTKKLIKYSWTWIMSLALSHSQDAYLTRTKLVKNFKHKILRQQYRTWQNYHKYMRPPKIVPFQTNLTWIW